MRLVSSRAKTLPSDIRWADFQNDRLPGMAADLARRQVFVIIANGVAAPFAKAATATDPDRLHDRL